MFSNIPKMLQELGLHPEDRDLHRFIQNGTIKGSLKDLRMSRVTFGVTSSSFLATQVLCQVARDYQEPPSSSSKNVSKQFYVDDCLTGAESVEEAVAIRPELNKLLGKARMKLHRWKSNSEQLLDTMPEDMREAEDLPINSPPDQCHKTLGVHWSTSTDSLHVATPTLEPNAAPTK